MTKQADRCQQENICYSEDNGTLTDRQTETTRLLPYIWYGAVPLLRFWFAHITVPPETWHTVLLVIEVAGTVLHGGFRVVFVSFSRAHASQGHNRIFSLGDAPLSIYLMQTSTPPPIQVQQFVLSI